MASTTRRRITGTTAVPKVLPATPEKNKDNLVTSQFH